MKLDTNKILRRINFSRIKKENMKINTMVLLFANAPTITGKLIDQGIKILNKDQSLDSAVTTSVYNMWSPLRARRLDKKKLLINLK